MFTDMELLKETTQVARDYLENRIPITEEEKKTLNKKINTLFNNHVTIS